MIRAWVCTLYAVFTVDSQGREMVASPLQLCTAPEAPSPSCTRRCVTRQNQTQARALSTAIGTASIDVELRQATSSCMADWCITALCVPVRAYVYLDCIRWCIVSTCDRAYACGCPYNSTWLTGSVRLARARAGGSTKTTGQRHP